MVTTLHAASTLTAESKLAVIDCDIHPALKSPKALAPVPVRALARVTATRSAIAASRGSYYPRANPERRAHRRLAAERPAARLRPRLHALPAAGRLGHGLRRAAAAARRWRASATTTTRRRCRRRSTSGRSPSGSTPSRACAAGLVVPYEAPELAVEEIERLRRPPGFVQVMLGDSHQRAARAAQVLADVRGGRRRTACRSASTSAARAATPITGAGWPSMYLEDHAGHVDGVPGAGHQPDLRGRLRAVPEAEDRADRGRLRLGAAAGVAAGRGLAEAGRRGART